MNQWRNKVGGKEDIQTTNPSFFVAKFNRHIKSTLLSCSKLHTVSSLIPTALHSFSVFLLLKVAREQEQGGGADLGELEQVEAILHGLLSEPIYQCALSFYICSLSFKAC